MQQSTAAEQVEKQDFLAVVIRDFHRQWSSPQHHISEFQYREKSCELSLSYKLNLIIHTSLNLFEAVSSFIKSLFIYFYWAVYMPTSCQIPPKLQQTSYFWVYLLKHDTK